VIDDCCSPSRTPPNLDTTWTRMDYYSKLHRSLGTTAYTGDASLELRKALLDAYSLADELKALDPGADCTLKDILGTLRPGDALISFNWDTAAEHIAVRVLRLDLAPARYPGADTRIRLIKPHGSLSWSHCAAAPGSQQCAVRWHDGAHPLLDPMKRDDVISAPNTHFCEPLVLGAVPIKSELLAEIQRDHRPVYETIADQWAEAVSATRQAVELIVAGYGFPPEDAYGHFLLREAVRQRGTSFVPSIVYYSERDIPASMREIFGDRPKYRFEGAVKPPVARAPGLL
jgi:hypothetical protein